MQKFNWKDFENGKIAINCKIEEEAVFFINECLKRNMDWFYIGDDLATYWNLYKEDTTYRNDCEGSKVLQISSKEYFQDEGIPVLDFKDIVKSKKDECGTSTEELAERICRTMKSIGHESTEYLNCYDDFEAIKKKMHELYLIKNKNYGNSFSKQFEEYGLTSVCIRLEDKLNRLKSLNKQLQDSQNGITDVNMNDESIKDTLIDLANYSVLAIMELGESL